MEYACALAQASGLDQDHELQVVIPVGEEALSTEAAWMAGDGCDPGPGVGLILRLDPPSAWQSAEDPYAAVEEWLGRMESLFAARPGLARAVQLGSRPDRTFEPEAYAFLVEKVSTLLRSVDQNSWLILGSMGDGAEDWFDALDAGRLAPYVRGGSLEDPAGLAAWMGRFGRRFPSLPVWLRTEPGMTDPAAWLRRYGEARAGRIRAVVSPSEIGSDLSRIVIALARALPTRFLIDPGPSGLVDPHESALIQVMDPLGPERGAVLPASGPRQISAGPAPLRQARALDLLTGASVQVEIGQAADSTMAVLSLPESVGPIFLRYVPADVPRGSTETVGVTEESDPTAEEIIAGLRAFEAGQERALSHYRAKATISYHYRAEALNESIDVTSVNHFFWKDSVAEYEETSLFVNGARWRGPAPPLPFIAAEKVKEVPLEIRLDQSYLYTLKGRSTVDGEPAWELAFEPIEPGRALYSGQIWVHRDSYARLRVRLVQHGVKEPITSNVDEIEYAPVTAPGADRDLWLPVRGYRQMVFTVLGRTVAVERRVAYEEFAINAPGFEEGRELAYASGKPILREDAEGFGYQVRQADGTLSRQTESPKNVAFFGGMGASTDDGLGLPFAGMNYFDFDFRGSGTQLDVAFAGVLLNVSWTDPSLGGTPWELTMEARATAYPDRFKKVSSDGRHPEEDLEVLEQRLFTTIGYPVTSYSKLEARLETAHDNYSQDEATDPNFILPPTQTTMIGTGRWRWHRQGWATDTWFSSGHRLAWDDWGFVDGTVPGGSGTADQDSFERWGLTVLKSFYPSRMNKISLGATYQAGRDLDRFSRYRIGDFRNARVRGYNSYDVTFDRGVTGQVAWLFTLPRGAASADLSLEGAVMENEEDFNGREYLIGGGVGISVSGPWGTLMSVRSGFGLGSSLDLDSSGFSVRLVVVKTFDHWPWGDKGSP